ncbi:hypothetical protein QTQ03_28320 [Micromonospora sp. WMMA1363]|uniref:hypothetical protein n=1 Tax=Micromonospora sp. WMMA1363 TaxID=3053985 RepID=UPI00259CABF1|nr:hypothetical protein [Micromonospora sp. WMMA1363]MDM4723313.1 hypothetical protein [Micromonospora sp. WMMA1363]
MPKKQSTAAQRAREAARQGGKYTQALRSSTESPVANEPDTFGGHEFEYEQETDLFRCSECRVYEVLVRESDGPIKPCTGLVGYGGDSERVYLLLTEDRRFRTATRASWRGRCAAPVLAGRHGSRTATGSCWSSRHPASSPTWPAGSH